MVQIAGRAVGSGEPPYIIAELSGNHNGDIARARAIMDAAKEAGADAVKLQTYTADTLTIDHDGPEFTIEGGLWHGRTLYELYREAHTPWDWHGPLFEYGKEIGITVLSSPFDGTAVDLLEGLSVPAYKIASFEIVDHGLIERAAATGKPLIMSTGLATRDEIDEAVGVARKGGCRDLILLHCISGYPTPAGDANLRTLPAMAERYGIPVGLSDHTMGTEVAVAAVALGAVIVEKHVTLHREDGGPDAAFSLEPHELARLCQDCRTAWSALGDIRYGPVDADRENLAFRRSLYVVEDVPAGAALTDRNVRSIRPGNGLAPKHLPEVVGRKARIAIARGSALDWSMVE